MSRYAKTWVAVIVAVLIAGLQTALSVLGDGIWTMEDTIVVLLAIVGAVGVYAVPNTPPQGQPSDPTISEKG